MMVSDISQMNNMIRPKIFPNLLVTIFLIIISITPILSRDLPHGVRLTATILWFVTALRIGHINNKSIEYKIILWWFLYLILQIVYGLVGISREFYYFFTKLCIYVVPIAMLYIVRFYNNRERKIIWWAILLTVGINVLQNFTLAPLDEAEELFMDVHGSTTRGSNAGGSAFVAVCFLIMPVLWMAFRYSRKNINKLGCICVIAVSGIYITMYNSRATALVILFLEVFLIVIIETKKRLNYRGFYLKSFIILPVAVAALFFLLPEIIQTFGFSARMVRRFTDLFTVMGGDDIESLQGGSFQARYFLWQTSINSFFSSIPHFIFGIGEKRMVDISDMALIRAGVGQHSEIFDLAAKYGVIGLVIFYNMMRKTIKYILCLTSNYKLGAMMRVYFIGLIIYAFVNNILFVGPNIIFFLFIAITVQLIELKKL